MAGTTIPAGREPCPDIDELRAMFRLTPKQALVAQLLVARRTNEEIADMLDITIGTARRHVEAVMLRTDTRSRWEIEHCVHRAVAQHVPQPGAQPSQRQRLVAQYAFVSP